LQTLRSFLHNAAQSVSGWSIFERSAAWPSQGNFLWPLIAVTSTNQMTLPLGLATFQGAHSTEWPLLMAGNVMSLVPMLAVFFIAQRYFTRSVAATGLAGT
jgi:multiple sugar transport system permease protein